MRISHRLINTIGLAAAGLVAVAGVAQAQVTSADVGINPTFEQTSGGVTSTGGFFSARAFFTSSTDFSTGTLTYSGSGSPQTLVNQGYPTPELGFGDQNMSFTTLQMLYPSGPSPTGDYTFDLSGGLQPETTFTINYAGGAYSNPPALTAASFSALQGMNAANPITVDFIPFTVSPNASNSDIIFSIVNGSDTTVFDSGSSRRTPPA
jgi:hypothetical protein